tara:strand:- start:243 stop:761 length:519 start_codon:yes stop_codon:yes gene_type:complete
MEIMVNCSVKGCKNMSRASGLCTSHYMKKWRKDNPTQVIEYNKQYQTSHIDEIVKHRNNPKTKRKKSLYEHEKTIREKLDIMKIYSKRLSKSDIPCCNCCGENSHHIALTIDHIHGKEKFGHTGRDVGKRLIKYLIREKYPSGFQVLCWNCNLSKANLGKCFHKGGKSKYEI